MKRSSNVFTEGSEITPDSSTFDLSHEVKLSLQMGKLYPVCCMEAVPGDKFDLDYVNMMRLAPLISPVMHRIRIHTEYFFVPNRIIFEGWEDFITGVGSIEAPYVLADGSDFEVGTLADYLGIPVGDYSAVPINISPLQAAAYYKIYDDWYRDQNQISEKFVPVVPGNNTTPYYAKMSAAPLKRAWEHDYFTSALPTSQQGTDVELPLVVGTVPVTLADPLPGLSFKVLQTDGSDMSGPVNLQSSTTSHLDAGGEDAILDPRGNLEVDIMAEAATINDLREAFSLQAFLEKSIRGGLRYIEQIWSHFRVKSSDARLQRAEMIGRSTQNMVISEVLATAQSNNDGATAEIAVGSMAGHGVSVGGSERVSFYAEEHGFVIGIVSVLPDTAYQDGLHKSFTRFDRLDYLWPEFANLGEMGIKNKEVKAILQVAEDPDGIWGYVPQYSDYRFMNSRVAGEFRTNLDFWHMGRIFASLPGLNSDFIEADPTTRIFAVEGENSDHIYAQIINRVLVNRKLPRYGIPSTLR